MKVTCARERETGIKLHGHHCTELSRLCRKESRGLHLASDHTHVGGRLLLALQIVTGVYSLPHLHPRSSVSRTVVNNSWSLNNIRGSSFYVHYIGHNTR
jgi:hypothetical protein